MIKIVSMVLFRMMGKVKQNMKSKVKEHHIYYENNTLENSGLLQYN